MSTASHAIRVGLRRGRTEFLLSLRSPQDQGFYLFMAVATLGYLYLNRHSEFGGIDLAFPTMVLPSMLGGIIMFSMVVGPAYAIAMEREDGTLLRAKATPHGMSGYVTGQIVLHSASLLPMFAVILVPAFFLFDGLMARGAIGWVTIGWVTVLGLLATLPLGMMIGSLAENVMKVGRWAFMPVLGLGAISGVFIPIQNMWGWVQGVAQAFPMYWIALGMRSAFLPDSAAAIEIGASWRTGQTILVLLAWTAAGFALAPIVLRRMARRQSGSTVEAAREATGQWVR